MIEWVSSTEPIAYPDAVQEMEAHIAAMIAGRADEKIWLLEHPALITAGARAKPHDLLQPERFPVFHSRRGGQFTYHGPGQRIGYVMLDLNRRGRDVRNFVFLLEEWLIRTLACFDICAERREGRIGLWVCRNDREDKIAAVGLRLRKWRSFHGFSVNISPNLQHFSAIVPCGNDPARYGVTSLWDLGAEVSVTDFDIALKQNFTQVWPCCDKI